ncbi:hypothetical protein C3495_14525 (plasmid) [Clostridiaceae bacterium 14S0207]|nr:hypothetical protein C3495_14525 [Clostridiaceae bacterium 14S0207]
MFNILKKLFKSNKTDIVKEVAFPNTDIPEEFELKFEFNRVKIAGVQYANPNKDELVRKDVLDLVFEHKNRHDKKAIKIMQGNIKLGYIPKHSITQSLIHKFYENKDIVVVNLNRFNPKSITMDLKFYGSVKRNYVCIDTTLNINKKSYKENLELVEEGDLYDITYDEDKNKFIVDAYGEYIGELKSKDSKQLDKYNNDIQCYINYIDSYYDNEDVVIEEIGVTILYIDNK